MNRVVCRLCQAFDKATSGQRLERLQMLHELDVAPHGDVLAHAFARRPGVVLGARDEVEGARPVAAGIAFGGLLEVGVQLEQRVVVRLVAQTLRRLPGPPRIASRDRP